MKYLDSTREAATGAASPLTGQLMAGPAALASMLNPFAAKAVATGAGVGLAGRAYESRLLRNACLSLQTPRKEVPLMTERSGGYLKRFHL